MFLFNHFRRRLICILTNQLCRKGVTIRMYACKSLIPPTGIRYGVRVFLLHPRGGVNTLVYIYMRTLFIGNAIRCDICIT